MALSIGNIKNIKMKYKKQCKKCQKEFLGSWWIELCDKCISINSDLQVSSNDNIGHINSQLKPKSNQDVIDMLNNLAKNGNLIEVERVIKKYRVPFEVGKKTFKILYESFTTQSRPQAKICKEFAENEQRYNDEFFTTNKQKFQEKLDSKQINEMTYPSYFSEMSKILHMEKKAQEIEFEGIINKNFEWLQENEFAIIWITEIKGPYQYYEDVFEFDEKKWKVIFNLNEEHQKIIDSGKFKINSTAFIFMHDTDEDYSEVLFKGKVTTKCVLNRINENEIEVIMVGSMMKEFTKNKFKGKKFSLVRWSDETTYRIQEESLINFCQGNFQNKNIADIIINKACPWVIQSNKIDNYFLNLNQYQKDAVAKSFSNKDMFLIHGPPGTGKTKVCSEIICQQLLQKPKSRILVCADSNQAVDNILDSTASVLPPEFHIKLLRVGSPNKIKEENKKFVLSYQADNHPLNFYIKQIMNENINLAKSKKEVIKENKLDTFLSPYEQIEMEKIKEKLILTSSSPSDVMPNMFFLSQTIKEFNRTSEWRKLIFSIKKQGIEIKENGGLVFASNNQEKFNLIDLIENFIKKSRQHSIKFNPLQKLYQQLEIVNDKLSRLNRISGRFDVTEKLEIYLDSKRKIEAEINENPLHRIEQIENKIKDNNSKITQLKKQIYYEILLNANLIFCTNTTSGKKIITETLKTKAFDLLIIDESTQATMFSTLIPLQKAKKVILAGDHCQLPPTINLKNAVEVESSDAKLKRESIAQKLEITLFESLIKNFDEYSKESVYKLKIQYRMNDSIVKFINDHFYFNQLISDESCKNRFISLLCKEPLVLIDITGPDKRRGTSYINFNEADIIEKILVRFKQLGYKNFEEIGIITPYVAQVELLDKKLKDFGIKSKTIDGFQGQEKDIIIISLVRSDVYRQRIKTKEQMDEYAHRTGKNYNELRKTLGFLTDVRRLNVMITRFRKKLIIVGDLETFSRFETDPLIPSKKILYKDLFEYIKKHDNSLIINDRWNLNRFLNSNIFNVVSSDISKDSIFSNKYTELIEHLISEIKNIFSFNFMIKQEDKLRNTFTKKYFSDEGYGTLVRIDIQESIEDNLKKTDEWNYWKDNQTRWNILKEAIAENGIDVVKTILNIIEKSTPLKTLIQEKIKEDINWIENKEPRGIEDSKSDINEINQESVIKNSESVIIALNQIIINPDNPEDNFNKVQKMIFDCLYQNALVVDRQIRFKGLTNLYKHLRISKTLNEVGLLTSEESLNDWNKNCTKKYKERIKGYEENLGYPIIVRIVSDSEETKKKHDRYIYTRDKGWHVGPGFNLIHDREGTVSELSSDNLNIMYKPHLELFNKGLDLINDYIRINEIVNMMISNKKDE